MIINWELLKHPINWLTVVLMVLIAGIALNFILQWQGVSPAASKSQTAS
jgi:hypothetical protein